MPDWTIEETSDRIADVVLKESDAGETAEQLSTLDGQTSAVAPRVDAFQSAARLHVNEHCAPADHLPGTALSEVQNAATNISIDPNNHAHQLQIHLRLVHQAHEYAMMIAAKRRLDQMSDSMFVFAASLLVSLMIMETMIHFLAGQDPSSSLAIKTGAHELNWLQQVIWCSYPFLIMFPIFYPMIRDTGQWRSCWMSTHLDLSSVGMQTMRMSSQWGTVGRIRPWSTLRNITYEPKQKRRSAKIKFEFTRGRPVYIHLDLFTCDRERAALIEQCRISRPDLKQQIGVIENALAPETEKTYTELWSDSLLHSADRQRLTALPPDTLLQQDRFRVLNQLGAGGQGTAYLCEDQLESELVVLKEYILPNSNNLHDRKKAIMRLEEESKVLSRLNHPQIVKARDVFVEDHRAYLILEHINGPPLKSIVAERGALPEDEVLDLALQMCEVLHYLHTLTPPMVHQDFTPDNLLLSERHVLKLVDFNVAKERENSKTSLVVGKHAYMPPEQFRGKACPQSDIYAFGATLFFLLTGAEPEPLSCLHPAEHNPVVSTAMDQIVARATALDLIDRYGCAQQILDDLKDLAPAPTPERLSEVPV